jgi:hypothetical protein
MRTATLELPAYLPLNDECQKFLDTCRIRYAKASSPATRMKILNEYRSQLDMQMDLAESEADKLILQYYRFGTSPFPFGGGIATLIYKHLIRAKLNRLFSS